MTYLKVKWVHDRRDDPVWLLSELDDERGEIRKVEIYADGRMDAAGPGLQSGSTHLSDEPVPEPDLIASQPKFVLEPVTDAEFERAWRESKIQGRSASGPTATPGITAADIP